MIYFDKVTKVYFDGAAPAVQDITLGIEPGEFVSLVGHSGAGKTTLLKMLFAEVSPTEGAVYFGSRQIGELSRRDFAFAYGNLCRGNLFLGGRKFS